MRPERTIKRTEFNVLLRLADHHHLNHDNEMKSTQHHYCGTTNDNNSNCLNINDDGFDFTFASLSCLLAIVRVTSPFRLCFAFCINICDVMCVNR